MIRKAISEVRASTGRLVRAVGEARTASVNQAITMSRPVTALQGVPGDPDQHSFLTAPLQNMVPVQIGNGSLVTNALAYSTNGVQARDYDSGRFGGLYAPAGEYLQPLLDTYRAAHDTFGRDIFIRTGKKIDPARRTAQEITKPVVAGRSLARPVTTNVSQSSDVW
jgi:hypothetical protein